MSSHGPSRDVSCGKVRVGLWGLLLLLVACSYGGDEREKLERRAGQTQVCITSEHTLDARVELIRRNGAEAAEIWVPSFGERCEWTELEPGDVVHGLVKAVGLRRDVIPPAWRHMMVGRRTMRLTLGMDGATRFAHSGRSQ